MKQLIRCGAILSACWLATAVPMRAENGVEARQQAIEKAREESIRRQESVIRAERMARDAEKLAKDKKYAAAAEAYEQILKFLPKSPATEKLHATVTRGVVDNRMRAANEALHKKDYLVAKDNAGKALAVDAANRDAQSLIAKADRLSAAPAEVPLSEQLAGPAESPQVKVTDESVRKLIRETRLWYEAGKLDEARERLEKALQLDPYNEEAMRMLKRIHEERERIEQINREAVSAMRMREVTAKWNPPIRREVVLPTQEGESGAAMREKMDTEKKLNALILPEVKFDGARIDSVVNFLVEESRRLDPDKRGVNIVLRLATTEGAPVVPPPTPAPFAPAASDLPPIPGAETFAPPAAIPTAPIAPSSPYPSITLNLRDIPLYDVLKLVTDLAGLRFRIDRRSVVIVPLTAPAEGIISRVYPIQPGVFRTLIEIPEGSGGGGEISRLGAGVKKAEREDVRKFFEDAGVAFPPGANITYNDRLSLLIVSNTPENLELFERVISQLNVIPSQVEIEAKFIEITQSNVDELGFKWNLGAIEWGGSKNRHLRGEGGSQTYPPNTTPGTSTGSDEITRAVRDVSAVLSANALDALLGAGQVIAPGSSEIFSLAGVLTDPQFQVVLRAVALQRNADLLSAPKVTTVSGNTAQIKVVREFRYPTEFTPPTATAAGSGTSAGAAVAVTPATPGGFETREVGVLLNVTPTVGPDGYTINLTLVPEVSDFDGFINYGSPGSIAAGNTIVPVNFVFNQPVFSSRQVTTTIQIWDGQTVVLGGLIREDVVMIDDKVPFLGDIPIVGRLFRSKAEAKSKRNLLIFVTATLVDPAGNKIHKTELGATPVPTPPTGS
jgi:general secretion pathway protein D